jgi:hypothetical protein
VADFCEHGNEPWGSVRKHVDGRILKCRRCYYEVPGMILLQAYLYAYTLLRGVTFEVLPLNSHALSPSMLPLLETFSGLLLCGIAFSAIVAFFRCLHYAEIFVLLRQI